MEDFPSNKQPAETTGDEPTTPRKVVQKVIAGKVVRRKKPLSKRFSEMFFGDDAQSVGHYVMKEVLIPAIKDTVTDVITQTIERALYGGESRSGSRRPGARRGKSDYVSYNRYAPPSSSSPPWHTERNEEPSRNMSRRARASHDFDEVILDSRSEANGVLDELRGLVAKYQQASVANLYEMVGITPDFTDYKYGWEDLRDSGVSHIRGGKFLLNLPKPEPLD